jgi:hypothetical protein
MSRLTTQVYLAAPLAALALTGLSIEATLVVQRSGR